MKREHTPRPPAKARPSGARNKPATIRPQPMADLLRRLGDGGPRRALGPGPERPTDRTTGDSSTSLSVEERCNAAMGCKTSEVALALMVQLAKLEAPNAVTPSDEEHLNSLLVKATAMVAELQPTTATEALLAAQMVGAQRIAMAFLHRAMLNGQTVDGVDRNINRAVRLMRIFSEQVETMAKLKGKGGQQRVVVEHVTVAAGGQAIVGTVSPGGEGDEWQ